MNLLCSQKDLDATVLQQGALPSETTDPKTNDYNFLFVLQVFTQLQSVISDASVSLHLVEVSPVLSQIQAQELTRTHSHEVDNADAPVYCSGETATGLPVSWYRRLEDVPAGTRGEVLWVVRQDVPTGSLSLQVSASSWLTSSLTLFPSTSLR